MGKWQRILEKLLPKTGEAVVDDAARAALRKDPEKYTQYLKALDEVYGPSVERQKLTGHTVDAFHGTGNNFDSFDKSRLGTVTNANSARRGFFTSNDPEVASAYAQLAEENALLQPSKVNPEYTKLAKQIEELEEDRKYLFNKRLLDLPLEEYGLRAEYSPGYDAQGNFVKNLHKNYPDIGDTTSVQHAALREMRNHPKSSEHAQLIKDWTNSHQADQEKISAQLDAALLKLMSGDIPMYRAQDMTAGNVQPLKLRLENPLIKEKMGTYKDNSYSKFLKDAQAGGHDSAIMKDAYDHPYDNTLADNYIFFEPSQARSRFAAFDPRFKDSKDLLAGAAGVAALGAAATGSDEAEAAGLETIMSKLGVGLDEAMKIKQAAKTIAPTGVLDENLRAIKEVAGYKRFPELYKKLGSGADYIAYETPNGRVLKRPKDNRFSDKVAVEDLVSPGLVEEAGMGPNTKIIHPNADRAPYFVQDKVNPLSEIEKSATRAADKQLDDLYKQRDSIGYNPNDSLEYQDIVEKIQDRKDHIFKSKGVDSNKLAQELEYLDDPYLENLQEYHGISTPSDIKEDPSLAFRGILEQQAQQRLSPTIQPMDLHEGNIGVDSKGRPVIFDTSRFEDFHPEEMDDSMRKAVENSYIASPEDRAALRNKIAAGVGGATAVGALASSDEAEAGPLDRARILADEYARLKGLGKITHSAPTATVDVNRARKIAEAFEALKHNPNDPDVKRAYDALIKETVDQFDLLKDSGLKTSKITSNMDNPYKTSKDMIQDVTENNHLWYFPTEQGFGPGGVNPDHPLLTPVNLGNEVAPANDAFRIVHDYFGHAKEGSSFGPRGEENAWREHMKMFSPEAQKALTTETRGQNSWVNYGPKGESNKLNPKDTVYAEQKAALLPDWAFKTNLKQSATPNSINPLPALEDMLGSYQRGLNTVAEKAADKIVRGTTPIPEGPQKEQYVENTAPAVSLGLSIAADPMNYIPGAGEALLGKELFQGLKNRFSGEE